jgi:hypothetical protein
MASVGGQNDNRIRLTITSDSLWSSVRPLSRNWSSSKKTSACWTKSVKEVDRLQYEKSRAANTIAQSLALNEQVRSARGSGETEAASCMGKDRSATAAARVKGTPTSDLSISAEETPLRS